MIQTKSVELHSCFLSARKEGRGRDKVLEKDRSCITAPPSAHSQSLMASTRAFYLRHMMRSHPPSLPLQIFSSPRPNTCIYMVHSWIREAEREKAGVKVSGTQAPFPCLAMCTKERVCLGVRANIWMSFNPFSLFFGNVLFSALFAFSMTMFMSLFLNLTHIHVHICE